MQSLRLNVRGREPYGIIAPGDEYLQTRERVMGELRKIRNGSGGQIITDAYARDDIFSGPFMDDAPDIVVQCASGYQLQNGVRGPLIQSALHGTWPRSGAHAPEGMALFWGSGVKKAIEFHAHITDIAPTVLEAFGAEAPDLDGRPLRELFSANGDQSPHAGPYGYSREQEALVTERLRMLGYL
jgi:predicted AlkP superfamily phosphohydrolase/phosphomutase